MYCHMNYLLLHVCFEDYRNLAVYIRFPVLFVQDSVWPTGFYLLSVSIDAGSNNSINPICCLFKYL